MVKVCESFNDTAEYFLDRLSQLIDEIYEPVKKSL